MGRTARDWLVVALCTGLQLLNVQARSSPGQSPVAGIAATAAALVAGLSRCWPACHW